MKLLLLYFSVIIPKFIFNQQTLLHSIVIIRHGARTNSEYFSKEMFPEYGPQQLTKEGKQQCKEKGEQFKQFLKKQQLNINNNSDYLVYSSPSDRTLLSIINYVNGSLDATDYSIDYQGIQLNQTKDSLSSQIIHNQKYEQEQNQQQKNLINYVINSIEEKSDFYFHADSLCPQIKQLEKQFKNELEIEIEKIKQDKQMQNLIYNLNKSYLKQINKTIDIRQVSGKQLSSIRDLYISAEFHSKLSLLPPINQYQLEQLYLFKWFYSFSYKYKHPLTNQLSVYFQVRDIIDFLTKVQFSIQTLKLYLQSSHDNQMANLINLLFFHHELLQYKQIYSIPYATQIQFDIFSISSLLYVKASINSIPLNIKTCISDKDYLCPLHTFITILSNINHISFWNQCYL